jgi:hypothetical protein
MSLVRRQAVIAIIDVGIALGSDLGQYCDAVAAPVGCGHEQSSPVTGV